MRSLLFCAVLLVFSASAQAAGVEYHNPDWSPDGKSLLFESTRDGKFAIYVIGADGSGMHRLTSGEANDEQARWSPDGRHIVFISDRDGHLQLYVMNAAGGEQRRLTNTTSSLDFNPSFAPDNRRVVFMTRPAQSSNKHNLAVVNVDGSGRMDLTSGPMNDMGPVWSPDGKWIAFIRAAAPTKSFREMTDAEHAAIQNSREIWLLRPDSTNLRQLTHNAVADSFPVWSRDSHGVYVVSTREQGEGICSIPLRGRSRFVAPATGILRPSVSPDGRRLAYSRNAEGQWRIYVYDLETRKEGLLIGN